MWSQIPLMLVSAVYTVINSEEKPTEKKNKERVSLIYLIFKFNYFIYMHV